jgi:hypothetical protein
MADRIELRVRKLVMIGIARLLSPTAIPPKLLSAPHEARDATAAGVVAISSGEAVTVRRHRRLRSVASGTTKDVRGALAFVDAAQAAFVKLPRADPGQGAIEPVMAWEKFSRRATGGNAEILPRPESQRLLHRFVGPAYG